MSEDGKPEVNEPKAGLAEFKAMGKKAGFDMDLVIHEIAQEVSKAFTPVVVEVVGKKIAESRAQLFEELKGLVGDVGEQLRKQMEEEARNAVALAVQELQKRAQANPAVVTGGRGGGLIESFLANPDALKTLIEVFKPQQDTQTLFANQMAMFLKGMTFGIKSKVEGISAEDLQSVFTPPGTVKK